MPGLTGTWYEDQVIGRPTIPGYRADPRVSPATLGARMLHDTGRRKFPVALDTLKGTALTASQVALCLIEGCDVPAGDRNGISLKCSRLCTTP